MWESKLEFAIDDKLIIYGNEYKVKGKITFLNKADNCSWTEHSIVSSNYNSEKWLSVDDMYNEYGLYTKCIYSESFQEDNLIAKGYKNVDNGIATVTFVSGDVDVEIGDEVEYKAFEDSSEENIIEIESWKDEKEYSKGCYIKKKDIKKVEEVINSSYKKDISDYNSLLSKIKANKAIIIASALLIIAIIGIISFDLMRNKVPIAKFLESDENFRYVTSITSDIDNNQKADVYATSMAVDNTTKCILDAISGDVQEVEENSEDGCVAIITDDEYCLVYTSEEGETLVQICLRAYTYASSNTLYHSHHSTDLYYRRCYYTYGYEHDRHRYKKYVSGYANYSDGKVNKNTNNKYKQYSNSIRQDSIGSRASSGGGTSSGK